MHYWEEQLGLKFSALVAGIVGGIISLTFEQRLSFMRAVLLIFTGGITSGYAFNFCQHVWGMSDELSGFFGFVMGLVSMRLIGSLIKVAEQVKENPATVLSFVELFKAIKYGSNIPNPRSNSSNNPDIHATGKTTNEEPKI